MPIVIDNALPAYKILGEEKIFVMDKTRAITQDIRPIEIAILNLMPTKEETETQFMRLLSNSPLQVNITLLRTESYHGKHTTEGYLGKFYRSFADVEDRHFDGMIVTGAPVEQMEFSSVAYWDELKRIFSYTATHVTSTIFICWGAMAALNYFFGVEKYPLREKLFGVFSHRRTNGTLAEPLMRGISDEFYMPHSRHSTVKTNDIKKCAGLRLLASSAKAGASVIASADDRQIFVLGHMEYDRDTLKKEYDRDRLKGLPIAKPYAYFADKACTRAKMNWASTANLFYCNWLNYCVYQVTPYRFAD